MRTIAVGLVLAGIFTAHLAAQRTAPRVNGLPQIGGSGGGEFSDDCPDGAVLTGLALHTGDDVDAVQALCLGRDLSRKIDKPFHGGPGGGKLAVLLCPPTTPAIIALDVAAEGQDTVIVNNIHIYCGIIGNNPSRPRYPDAVFDGPPYKASSGLFAPFSLAPVSGHQACRPDEVAIGIHGNSGKWLDAIGLICLVAARLAPPSAPPATKAAPRLTGPPLAVGRLNTQSTPQNHGSVCGAAAAARARNSPAAPFL